MAQEILTFYSVFTSKVLKKKNQVIPGVTEYLEERQPGLKAGSTWARSLYVVSKTVVSSIKTTR